MVTILKEVKLISQNSMVSKWQSYDRGPSPVCLYALTLFKPESYGANGLLLSYLS